MVTPERVVEMPGGTAWYFAMALANLGVHDFRLITKTGPKCTVAVEELRSKGVDVKDFHSCDSVFFENTYGENSNNRTQRVLAKSEPFEVSNIDSTESRIWHLGALLADDVSPDFIRSLSSKGRISVDAQGFLRKVKYQKVIPCEWEYKESLFPLISILKANEHEMRQLTGTLNPVDAAKILASQGIDEVVLTLGDLGSYILANGKSYEVPAYRPYRIVDATGCGDTYMAGYLWRRICGDDPGTAGKYGAAMCTLKICNAGPFSGTLEQVTEIMEGK